MLDEDAPGAQSGPEEQVCEVEEVKGDAVLETSFGIIGIAVVVGVDRAGVASSRSRMTRSRPSRPARSPSCRTRRASTSSPPKEPFQGMLAIFGLWYEDGSFDMKPERTLNEQVPGVKVKSI